VSEKPTDWEVLHTTLPADPLPDNGWRCGNHPEGESIANHAGRKACWACGKEREPTRRYILVDAIAGRAMLVDLPTSVPIKRIIDVEMTEPELDALARVIHRGGS
jgi:hypothetical protein